VRIAFCCYGDDNGNNQHDPDEPGLDFDMELYPRNE
jgi:hypothetical protein